MTNFKSSKPPNPIEISKFMGINEAVGETEVTLGEAVRQVNFRITQNFKAQKRSGHKTWINFGNAKNVQGMWEGTIGGKHVLIVVNDGKVHEYKLEG